MRVWIRSLAVPCVLALAIGCMSENNTTVQLADPPVRHLPPEVALQGSLQYAPLVDHHLHLLSPAAAATALREVLVPPPLAKLLRERERNWNEAEGLARLFTPDSALSVNQSWSEGAQKISAFLSTGYTGPYLFRPSVYRISGSEAQISGFLLEGDGTDSPFGYFTLNLSQARDKSWRIASEVQVFPGPTLENPYTAGDLIKKLDEARIKRGVVLSNAYYFALSPDQFPGEYKKVQAENDWAAGQVSQFPDRLVAFCSVNPLRSYAIQEVERCAQSGRFKGLKLHLNGAQIDYQDPKEVAKARHVFETANRHRLPLIVHVRSSDNYGQADAEVFLRQLVAAAPDVTIQIAHLWGGETFSPSALAVYADAVVSKDPVARNLYFDVSGMNFNTKPESYPAVVAGMRRIGIERLLYASDGPPLQSWKTLQTLPLTEQELRAIASNVAPYMK